MTITCATYQTAAIENAVQREAEIAPTRKFPAQSHASGFTQTPHGELAVHFVVAEGVSTYMPKHMRKNWSLDGKRIAAKKLEALFG